MKRCICIAALGIVSVLGCKKSRPVHRDTYSDSPLTPSVPQVQPDDFRQIQSDPRPYFDQIVHCKFVGRPTALEYRPFPHARYADDLDHFTKEGTVFCADSINRVRILVQPSEESYYFGLHSGDLVTFRLLHDRDTISGFALRIQ